ncbi:MAG TPA: hypothetical protein VIV62_07625 [Chthoniobacterales bacterium]|jgi:hypothetical protein
MNHKSSTPDSPPSVRLHIERLIVDESLLATGQNHRLRAAIETELTRVLREHGLAGLTSGALYDRPTRKVHISRPSSIVQVGRQIARTIYTALSPESASAAAQDRHH